MRTQITRIARRIAFVIIALTATAEARENMLSNGGFEQGIAGWQPDPKHQVVPDVGQAHSGSNCLTGEVP